MVWYFIGVYSYFEKGCRKKCTRQSRKVLWVALRALFFKKIGKNGTVCLRVRKESNKSRFDSFTRYEQCIDHIPYYLSRLSRAHFFRQPFSKQLYIINRTLHGCLETRNFSSHVENISLIRCALLWNIFQHSKRNFVSPRAHVISSISSLREFLPDICHEILTSSYYFRRDVTSNNFSGQ